MMRGRSIREKSIVVMALVAVLCLVGPAVQAATVTLDMRDNGDGTFDLYAEASLGDNFGIAYYNIDLINILTAVHQSPMGLDVDDDFIDKGFTGAGADLSGPGALFANQVTNDDDSPRNLLYGIGQTAGSYNVFGLASNRGVPWLAPVLLGSGTYDVAGPAPWFGTDTNVNVFYLEWTEGEIQQGTVGSADVVLIPEPATMVLLALGAGLMVTLRRRR